MELNQSITSSSFEPPVNPDPADDDDVTFSFNPQQQDDAEDDDDDDVTFRFNHLQIHNNRSYGEPSHQPAADDADDVTIRIIDDNNNQAEDDDVSFNVNKTEDNHNNNNQQQQDAVDDDVSFNVNKINFNNNNNNSNQDAEDDDDVSFVINKTDDNNQQQEAEDDDDDVSFNVNKIDDNHINSTDDDDDDDVDDEDDGDFTFMYVGDNNNINNNNNNNNTELPDADVSGDGQIRKAFPLFDQSLLLNLNVNSDDVKRHRLPVDNVFIESPRQSPSTNGETNGTVTALPKESNNKNDNDNNNNNNINIKSNSTGFSKLWRFRNNEMNRSNSDGRDAFVFLEATTSDGKSKGAVKGVAGEVVKKKSKKSKASAHEVYLKQKGGQTEEERKRSYLPYRPGLMGFFTNVNGGLSKNVHPF